MNTDITNLEKLGEGLWSRVYDVGDETVLKISKRFTPGIGDGLEKLENEWSILEALQTLKGQPIEDITVPRLLGKGKMDPKHPARSEGFEYWTHTTRLNGTVYKVEEINTWSATQHAALGATMGSALAKTHAAFEKLPKDTFKPYQTAHAVMRAFLPKPDAFVSAALDRIEAEESALNPAKLKPVHGDYNISNLLFTTPSKVSGVLDFAEASMDFIERDFASILCEIPQVEDAMITAYEAHSPQKVNRRLLKLTIATETLLSLVIEHRGTPKIETINQYQTLFQEQISGLQ